MTEKHFTAKTVLDRAQHGRKEKTCTYLGAQCTLVLKQVDVVSNFIYCLYVAVKLKHVNLCS
jgi:hypothetical protein